MEQALEKALLAGHERQVTLQAARAAEQALRYGTSHPRYPEVALQAEAASIELEHEAKLRAIDLRQAEVGLAQVMAHMERIAKLKQEQAIGAAEVQSAQAEVEQAKLKLEKAHLELETAKRKLEVFRKRQKQER